MTPSPPLGVYSAGMITRKRLLLGIGGIAGVLLFFWRGSKKEKDCPLCCATCSGSGEVECSSCEPDGSGECSECYGSGECIECDGSGECSECDGRGKCRDCNGNGKVVCPECEGQMKAPKWCSKCRGARRLVQCMACDGIGFNKGANSPCNLCGGDGWAPPAAADE